MISRCHLIVPPLSFHSFLQQKRTMQALTLVVTQHGSHGSCVDMEAIKVHLRRQLEVGGRVVHRVSPLVEGEGLGEHLDVVMWETDACKMFGTEKGVESCAATVTAELETFVTSLLALTDTLHLVLIGHSMGGLILRSLITQSSLIRESPKIQPLLYMSIATPHIGVHQTVYPLKALMSLWGMLASTTCVDMLHDNEVLDTLCDEEHINALSRFSHRVNCANVKNDHMCGFHTCSLTAGGAPGVPHESEEYSSRISKPVVLTAQNAPTEQQVREAFPQVEEGKLQSIVSEMAALRTLPWKMVAVDYADSHFSAHVDIIGKGTVNKGGKGDISAKFIADMVHSLLEKKIAL